MNRLINPMFIGVALSALTVAAGSHAATIQSITTSTVGNDTQLDSITIDQDTAGSVTYHTASLIGIDVTGYASSNDSFAYVDDDNPIPATGSRAAQLDGDRFLTTGLTNIPEDDTGGAGPTTFLTFNFNRAVVNGEGAEIILTDLGGNDSIRVTKKDGSLLGISSSNFIKTLTVNGSVNSSVGVAVDIIQQPGNDTTDSLAELESAVGVVGANSSQDIGFLLIDLTDLGYGVGESITSLGISSSPNNGFDPGFIGAIPEPASLVLLCLGSLCLLTKRRAFLNTPVVVHHS